MDVCACVCVHCEMEFIILAQSICIYVKCKTYNGHVNPYVQSVHVKYCERMQLILNAIRDE